MSVTATMDFSPLARAKAAIESQLPKELAPVIRMDIDPHVPKLSHSLADSAFVNEAALEEGKIVWGNMANYVTGKPVNNYAQRQYYEHKSKGQWDLKAYAANKERWHRGAQQLAMKIAQGVW